MTSEIRPVHIPVNEDYIAWLKNENIFLEGYTKKLAARAHASARRENVARKRAAAEVEEYKKGRHILKKKYNTVKRRLSELSAE